MAELNGPLLIGAAMNGVAALVHFACIPLGPKGFQFLGAGEPIVRLSRAGHWYPPVLAVVIGAMLLVGAAYGLSGAGVLPPFPYVRPVLIGIAAVYGVRALAFPLLKPAFPGNSEQFWYVSSMICLLMGGVHGLGVAQVWPR